MKMVSAAKFGRAEKELRPARVYGAGASGLLNVAEFKNLVDTYMYKPCAQVRCK